MRLLETTIILFFLYASLSGCREEKNFAGNWKASKVVIWNNYHNASDTFDVKTKQFTSSYKEDLYPLTQGRKDTLLHLLSNTYLRLQPDGRFDMEDYAFFVLDAADTLWDHVRGGAWIANEKDSVLHLTQPNGTAKCFKILNFETNTMTVGELYECGDKITMTEVTLHR